jgi:type VI secretion system secreted protein VgrG
MPNGREITVTGALGAAGVLVDHFAGREVLGRVFQYEVTLLSPSPTLDLSALVGDTLTIAIERQTGTPRSFNGYVTRMSMLGTYDNFARYRATLHPWLHLLSSRTNSRIFQNESVPDIAKALFREHGFADFEDALSETYKPREFVVQYRESDFNFVSRLLEQAGIYYFFRHEATRHVLVLADSRAAHQVDPGYAEVPFHPEGAPTPTAPECVNSWEVSHQWRPGAYASNDFDFERPRADLTSQLQAPVPNKKGDLEVYDYPGGYTDAPSVERYVRTRLEALQSDVRSSHGGGDVRGLGVGNLFALTGFPGDGVNGEYLIPAISYEAANPPPQTGADGQSKFRCSFTAINAQTPFRPALSTPRPRIDGAQTALVVGKAGEEIWTDKFGRVKVQFHWDRTGKKDENSSCWIRVAQVWAGSRWGAMHIPRIGQEVVVQFLDGDPDRPLITGRVYNGDNFPPYDLPDNQTQSGIKSRSSKGGGPRNFNELRFEDKLGAEQVYAQAEKDLEILVKNDEHRAVGHDRQSDITNDERTSIGSNRTEKVGKNQDVTIGVNRTETIGTDDTLSVGGKQAVSVTADQSVTVNGKQVIAVAKDQQLDVGAGRSTTVAKDDVLNVDGNWTISVSKGETLEIGGKLTIDVAEEITIKTGSASISMKKNGDITISGKAITVNASADGTVKAGGNLTLKGTKISQN